MADVEIDGLADVMRRLDAVPQLVQEKLKAAMERGAKRVVAMMKRLCPVYQGTLRASIGWTWGEPPEGAIVLGTVESSDTVFGITIYAGNKETLVSNSRGIQFQNARIQEFGTKDLPAHPYFYPAWRANKRGVNTAQKRAITTAVKSLFG